MDKVWFWGGAILVLSLLTALLWIVRDTANIRADLRAIFISTLGTTGAFALAIVGFSIQDGINDSNSKNKENSEFVARAGLYINDIEKAADETASMIKWVNLSVDYCSGADKDTEYSDFKKIQQIGSALTRRASFRFSQTFRDLSLYLIRFDSNIYSDLMLASKELEGINEQIISIKDRISIIIAHVASQYVTNQTEISKHNPALKRVVCSIIRSNNQSFAPMSGLYGLNLAHFCALKDVIASGKSPEMVVACPHLVAQVRS